MRACSTSRSARSSRLRGLSSRTIAAKSTQNASALSGAPARASAAMKSCRTFSTHSPATSIRAIISHLLGRAASRHRVLLHDGEAYRAARAMRLRHVAPALLGIGARVERADQPLGAADDLLEAERAEFAANDPETMVIGHERPPDDDLVRYSAATESCCPSNCALSVESASAVVDAAPPETARLMRSK